MSGKHAEPTTPGRPRDLVPFLAGLVLAAVLMGSALVTLRPAGQPTGSGPATATGPSSGSTPARDASSPAVTGSPRTTRGIEERAGRAAQERPSPTVSPGQPVGRPPGQPSGAGSVVSAGTCAASFYAEPQPTASGEPFDPEAFTAAHRTLRFNTRVRVTNQANGRSVVVRINDRGPYVAGRCLDLARAPFRAIASLTSGVIDVRYEVLG